MGDYFYPEERGSSLTSNYRVYINDRQGPVSALHDVPLWRSQHQFSHMIVRSPRWSNAKMILSLEERLNPIKHDLKKDTLQFVYNLFPHHGYSWNYGALPQTWHSPYHVDAETQGRGNNEPLDVIDISERVKKVGNVRLVKVLGALAFFEEEKIAWKVIAIDNMDPLTNRLHDVSDIEREFPGMLQDTIEWFRHYKVPDGEPVSRIAFDGVPKDAAFTHRLIDEMHENWRILIAGEAKGGSDIHNPKRVERSRADNVLRAAPPSAPPGPVPPGLDKWFFLRDRVSLTKIDD